MSADITVTVVDGTHTVVMGASDVRLLQDGLERGILQAEIRNNKVAEGRLRDLLTRLRRAIEARTRD